jgi:hypothetical protein
VVSSALATPGLRPLGISTTRRDSGASHVHKKVARTQALCCLLDKLLDAEDDLLALAARPEALSGWRRERLGEFSQRVIPMKSNQTDACGCSPPEIPCFSIRKSYRPAGAISSHLVISSAFKPESIHTATFGKSLNNTKHAKSAVNASTTTCLFGMPAQACIPLTALNPRKRQ